MDKPQGEIRIACSSEGKQWKFLSRTMGGIELAALLNESSSCSRLGTPPGQGGGTGVGPSLVKKIVEMYSGKIGWSPKSGRKHVFLHLPKM